MASRPSPALVATSLAVVATALLLPLSPLGRPLGLVPPPALFYPILAVMVGTYLALVQTVKTLFYRHHPAWRKE